jgi:hypothetical protein
MTDTDEEFFEDFGAAEMSDTELEVLLNRARANGDRELRRLVKQFQALRYVTALLLERIEAYGSPEELTADQAVKLARFVVRSEDGFGT